MIVYYFITCFILKMAFNIIFLFMSYGSFLVQNPFLSIPCISQDVYLFVTYTVHTMENVFTGFNYLWLGILFVSFVQPSERSKSSIFHSTAKFPDYSQRNQSRTSEASRSALIFRVWWRAGMSGPAQIPRKIIASLCFTSVQLWAEWCGAWCY